MRLKKVSAAKASVVAADIELSEEALQLLSEDISPGDYLQRLIDAELTSDAILFLARAMPRREATWWACLSARHTVSDTTPPSDVQALELVEQWVFKPSDENRYAAHDAAESVSNESPIYWSGMATFWSGGSLSAPGDAAIEPAENICGLAVAGAVTLAGLGDDPSGASSRYDLLVRQGLAIANGENAREVKA